MSKENFFKSREKRKEKNVLATDLSNENKIEPLVTGLPTTARYFVQDIFQKNLIPESCCRRCITEFDTVGKSFLKMLRKIFISDLPFDDATNEIILNCTNCEQRTPPSCCW